MTKATNKKFAGLRSVFAGDPVFSIEVKDVDLDFDKKSEELRIAKPAAHTVIKSLIVNEIKAVKLQGDLDGLLINGGGATGLTFAHNEKYASESTEDTGSKKWFSDYLVVKSIVNARNEGEIMRLRAIKADVDEQINFLVAANQANDDAAQRYE